MLRMTREKEDGREDDIDYAESSNNSDIQRNGSSSSSSPSTAGNAVVDAQFVRRNPHWIVLVDDEESIRLSVGDFLYDAGFQVTACDSAESLLTLLSSSKSSTNGPPHNPTGATSLDDRLPDAIVSDVRMPGGMDGVELLRTLRQTPQHERIPVILLTAKALTADRVAGYRAGADAYLPKPFYPEELLSLLDNLILRRAQIKEARTSLADLKEEMTSIKAILKQNSARTVQKTNVYLTPTERDVLELLCRGYTNKEIAERRSVSKDRIVKTVKKIMSMTQTKNRTELVRWAFSTGYVSPRRPS